MGFWEDYAAPLLQAAFGPFGDIIASGWARQKQRKWYRRQKKELDKLLAQLKAQWSPEAFASARKQLTESLAARGLSRSGLAGELQTKLAVAARRAKANYLRDLMQWYYQQKEALKRGELMSQMPMPWGTYMTKLLLSALPAIMGKPTSLPASPFGQQSAFAQAPQMTSSGQTQSAWDLPGSTVSVYKGQPVTF